MALACNKGGTCTTTLDVYMPIEFFYTVIVVVNNYTHAVMQYYWVFAAIVCLYLVLMFFEVASFWLLPAVWNESAWQLTVIAVNSLHQMAAHSPFCHDTTWQSKGILLILESVKQLPAHVSQN